MSDFNCSKIPLKDNEIRIIKLNKDAIFELLWELLMSNGKDYFNISPSDAENITYSSDYDSESLVYIVQKLEDVKTVDFELLRRYVSENIDFTTDSLFSESKNFISISASDVDSQMSSYRP